jgi:hypothetical protein
VSEDLSQLLDREGASVGHRVQLAEGVAEKVNCIVLCKVSLHLLVEVLGLLSQRLGLRIEWRGCLLVDWRGIHRLLQRIKDHFKTHLFKSLIVLNEQVELNHLIFDILVGRCRPHHVALGKDLEV